MLKWAVNRIPENGSTNEYVLRKRRRTINTNKSDLDNLDKRALKCNKENVFTSTPNFKRSRQNSLSPTLKDISNVTIVHKDLNTSSAKKHRRDAPPQYASTLPIFGVEYMPFTLEDKPLLPLANNLNQFFTPRYFPNGPDSDIIIRNTSSKELKLDEVHYDIHSNDVSQNLSKVGDETLEKIIDDILESAQKIPKPKNRSSTYQRGEDPANDLIFHKGKLIMSPKKFIEAVDTTIILNDIDVRNEREVRTPDHSTMIQPLKRQRVVRRKHNIQSLKKNPDISKELVKPLTQTTNFQFDVHR